jgi:hypothetical protein
MRRVQTFPEAFSRESGCPIDIALDDGAFQLTDGFHGLFNPILSVERVRLS